MSDSTRKKVYSFSALGLALMVFIGALLPFLLRPRSASAASSSPFKPSSFPLGAYSVVIPDDDYFSISPYGFSVGRESDWLQFEASSGGDYSIMVYFSYSSEYGTYTSSSIVPSNCVIASSPYFPAPYFGSVGCGFVFHFSSYSSSLYSGLKFVSCVSVSVHSADPPLDLPSFDSSSSLPSGSVVGQVALVGRPLYYNPIVTSLLSKYLVPLSVGTSSDDYDRGYTDGLNKGQSDTFTNPLIQVIQPVVEFLNTDLFGNVSIGTFFTIVVFVLLALIFLKMFAGG